jgi:uncharacterized protein
MAQTSRATTWVNEILSGLAAASGVGYFATAYSISRWLTRSSPALSEPPSDTADYPWDSLTCTTADGLRLAGWCVAPPKSRGTIALFHGLRGNRTQLLDRIAFLLRAGYRCVAFDHRAHGQSEGKVTSFGWHEARDAAAVAELVATQWPDEPRAALGISMGAAALCFAGTATAIFQAFILESVYHDLASAFRNRVGCGYPSWFGRFSRGVIWVTERRLGMSIAAATPADHIAVLAPRPVLLMTGSDDPHAPPEDVARLFERCADPREFHLIAGAGHGDVDTTGGRRYEELVLGFLERHLAVC